MHNARTSLIVNLSSVSVFRLTTFPSASQLCCRSDCLTPVPRHVRFSGWRLFVAPAETPYGLRFGYCSFPEIALALASFHLASHSYGHLVMYLLDRMVLHIVLDPSGLIACLHLLDVLRSLLVCPSV